MPFDIAGSDSSYLLSNSVSSGKKAGLALCVCGFGGFIGSIALLSAGSAALGRSEGPDYRAMFIDTFQVRMAAWDSKGISLFDSLRFKLDGHAMQGQRKMVSPEIFGEKAPLFVTPPLNDYRYVDYMSCPAQVNSTCNVHLQSAEGNATISTSIVARQQIGPIPHSKMSHLCQWWDGDFFHPMAAMGMGECNTAMNGNGHPQSYNYGPSKCVLDHYLDAHGCPNDRMPTQALVNYGWTWATHLTSKPRFTYEPSTQKCWDYSNCVCSCNGRSFPTDASHGFTGFGFYAGGRWYDFSIGSMSGNQRAAKCSAAFDAIGQPCEGTTKLICFRAGGYPKKPCTEYCKEQDTRTAHYTPPATFVQMTTLYGPWGSWGQFPSYTNVPATCSWTTTTTKQVTKLHLVADNKGHAVTTKWVQREEIETNSMPFPTPAPKTVNVQVEISAEDGPRLAAADILNSGCPLEANFWQATSGQPNKKCFGKTLVEEATNGAALVGTGVPLLLLALGCCAGSIVCARKTDDY